MQLALARQKLAILLAI